jgi:hypothetical protein
MGVDWRSRLGSRRMGKLELRPRPGLALRKSHSGIASSAPPHYILASAVRYRRPTAEWSVAGLVREMVEDDIIGAEVTHTTTGAT